MIKFNNEVYDLSMRQVRGLLHSDLDTAFWNLEDITEEMEEELEQAHQLISDQDEDALANFMIGFELSFEKVSENVLLAEALKIAGYKVEKSKASRSLYVTNDKGLEVRIADHKRPAVVEGHVGTEWEYENEIIVENNTISKQALESANIKLSEKEYILG